MKLNFVLSQADKPLPLSFVRSGAKGLIDVPYDMESGKPLREHLNSYIPQEWLDTINDLKKQERAIIDKRKQLMAEYRIQIVDIAAPLIEQFPIDHPEYFI
jgi:hypothetical protein